MSMLDCFNLVNLTSLLKQYNIFWKYLLFDAKLCIFKMLLLHFALFFIFEFYMKNLGFLVAFKSIMSRLQLRLREVEELRLKCVGYFNVLTFNLIAVCTALFSSGLYF